MAIYLEIIVEPTASEDVQTDDIQPASTPYPPFSPPQGIDILEESTQKQRAGLRWIILSSLLVIGGVGGWLGYQTFLRQPPAAVEVVTAPVVREDLEVTITEAGVVELGGQQTFNAPSDVTVEAVLVEERQRVEQGQVLLELRDRTLQQRLDDQLVENRINQLTLQRNREILEERRARLLDAETRLQDAQELLDQGFISEDEFRQDKRDLEDAQSAVRDADVEVTKAELTVQQDQVNTDNIRLQLEDNQIVAPIDAIVLKVDVKPGDGVEREGRLLSIGDPAQETIRLQLTTLNASKVGVNLPVQVSLIGPNPEVFAGRIARVSPQAVGGDGNAEQATVEAEARLTQPSGFLIPGSAVSVEIVLEQRQNVLVLPVTALQRDAATAYVWVQDADNTAQRREVMVGLETLEGVEVLSGLQGGEEIVVAVPPEITLTPGQPLTAPQPEEARPGGDRPPRPSNSNN